MSKCESCSSVLGRDTEHLAGVDYWGHVADKISEREARAAEQALRPSFIDRTAGQISQVIKRIIKPQ